MAHLKYRWREVRPHLISGLLFSVVRIIGMTLRIQIVNQPPNLGKAVLCGWHGRSFAFASAYRGRGFWVIISQSRDGEMQARIFRRLGFQIIRGSTGRGGVRALVEAIRTLKDGGTMAMTPDGPRGPSGVVQPGVVAMAHKSGAALFPVGVSAARRWVVKSWDKFIVPKPFSRCVIVFGEPVFVAKDADETAQENARLELQERMHQAEAEAERLAGHTEDRMVRSRAEA
jgi:lysophospholipid acyltransferase (LPLAT)-like uncharacterized protein